MEHVLNCPAYLCTIHRVNNFIFRRVFNDFFSCSIKLSQTSNCEVNPSIINPMHSWHINYWQYFVRIHSRLQRWKLKTEIVQELCNFLDWSYATPAQFPFLNFQLKRWKLKNRNYAWVVQLPDWSYTTPAQFLFLKFSNKRWKLKNGNFVQFCNSLNNSYATPAQFSLLSFQLRYHEYYSRTLQ